MSVRMWRIRERMRCQRGSTLVIALGVLLVVAMTTTAALSLGGNDIALVQHDLDAKRAYAAAEAGVQAYLYALNSNSTSWWETCSNDETNGNGSPVTVPGSTAPPRVTYAYRPVWANGNGPCPASTTNPISYLIDNTTDALLMEVTGTSNGVSRTIVASFHTTSPLNFLWYTVHESTDTAGGGAGCSIFFDQSNGEGGYGPPSSCWGYWTTGDTLQGPVYTQDQFLIWGSPAFGRDNSTDTIVAAANPYATSSSSACAQQSGCQGASFSTTPITDPPASARVPLPTTNAELATDAARYGLTTTGATTLYINGSTAVAITCDRTSSCGSSPTVVTVDLETTPLVYDYNDTSCSPTYDPTSVSYSSDTTTVNGTNYTYYYGTCGDIYVQGQYTTPMTLAAANNVVLTGNLTTTESNGVPTGTATAGLVAGQYVRVMHTCASTPNVTVDGALLALNHALTVDNFECGPTDEQNQVLTINGSVAQQFEGYTGTGNGNGYLEQSFYDNRFQVLLPPYLFDLQAMPWTLFRQTLCMGSGSSACP